MIVRQKCRTMIRMSSDRSVLPRKRRGGSLPRVGAVAASERLEIRMTPEQRVAWSALAAANGMTLAELVRAAVEHYEYREQDELAELGRDVLASVRKRFPQRKAGR